MSFRGRFTLIKVVLANFPIYFLSLFKCPAAIIKSIKRLQQEFVCQGVQGEKEISCSGTKTLFANPKSTVVLI